MSLKKFKIITTYIFESLTQSFDKSIKIACLSFLEEILHSVKADSILSTIAEILREVATSSCWIMNWIILINNLVFCWPLVIKLKTEASCLMISWLVLSLADLILAIKVSKLSSETKVPNNTKRVSLSDLSVVSSKSLRPVLNCSLYPNKLLF